MEGHEPRRRKRGLEGFGFAIPEALTEAKQSMQRTVGNVIALQNTDQKSTEIGSPNNLEQSEIETKQKDQTTYYTEYQTKGLSLDMSSDLTVGHTQGQAKCPSITPETTPSITPQSRPTKGQTKYHTPHQTPGMTFDHADDQTKYWPGTQSSDFEIYPLTINQATILQFLVEKKKKITAMREIERATGISYNTIRKVLQLFFEKRFVIKEKARSVVGSFQGFTYSVNETVCKKLLEEHHFRGRSVYHTHYLTKGQANGQTEGDTHNPDDTWPDRRPAVRSDPLLLDDDLSGKINPHLTNADIADMYQNLFNCGLRSEHLFQVIKAWRLNQLNLSELHDSLEKAEWDVRENVSKMDKPLGYVLKALKNGSYTAPKGFKFRRQIQAEESARIARELRDLAEKEIEDSFVAWWAGLSSSEKGDIDGKIAQSNKGFRLLSKDSPLKEEGRKEFFRDNVFKKGH